MAIALPWSYADPASLQGNGWYLRKLPRWAWIWGNDIDGAEGDRERRWLDRDAVFKNAWLNRWWWLAIRNPVNNASRNWPIFSLDIHSLDYWWVKGPWNVKDKIGSEGMQYVLAVIGVKVYQGFYLVKRWGKSSRGLVVQIGFKLYPRELINPPDDEGRVSFTFEIAPFKKIS